MRLPGARPPLRILNKLNSTINPFFIGDVEIHCQVIDAVGIVGSSPTEETYRLIVRPPAPSGVNAVYLLHTYTIGNYATSS